MERQIRQKDKWDRKIYKLGWVDRQDKKIEGQKYRRIERQKDRKIDMIERYLEQEDIWDRKIYRTGRQMRQKDR